MRRSFDDRDHALPGAERLRQTEARGWRALRQVIRAGPDLPVLVSHGGLMASLLSGIDPQFGFDDWAAMTNPDGFILTIKGSVPVRWSRSSRWVETHLTFGPTIISGPALIFGLVRRPI